MTMREAQYCRPTNRGKQALELLVRFTNEASRLWVWATQLRKWEQRPFCPFISSAGVTMETNWTKIVESTNVCQAEPELDVWFARFFEPVWLCVCVFYPNFACPKLVNFRFGFRPKQREPYESHLFCLVSFRLLLLWLFCCCCCCYIYIRAEFSTIMPWCKQANWLTSFEGRASWILSHMQS